MICKDCRVIASEGLWSVELCPKHEAITAEGAFLAMAEEEQAERRRYALLQAVAKLQAAAIVRQGTAFAINYAVTEAEDWLSEIEKREKSQS